MNRPLAKEVMNLQEAAKYLRLSPAKVRKLAETEKLPARKVDNEWRFLKSALEEWLRGKPTPREVLLQQAGALADDDSLPELLASIYEARGRPEVEPGD